MSLSVNNCRSNPYSCFSSDESDLGSNVNRPADSAENSNRKPVETVLRIAKNSCSFNVKRENDDGPNKITLYYGQLEKKIKHMDVFYEDDGWSTVADKGRQESIYQKFARSIHGFVHDHGVEHRKVTFMGEKDVSIFYQEKSKRFISVTKNNELWSGWELSPFQVAHLKANNAIGAHDNRMQRRR